jgi:hypothetical protein
MDWEQNIPQVYLWDEWINELVITTTDTQDPIYRLGISIKVDSEKLYDHFNDTWE